MEKLPCGYFKGNEKSRRVQEKCGFRYRHTAQDAPCQTGDLLRTEHVTCITRVKREESIPYISPPLARFLIIKFM